jgi:two-component system phosphate regulon sensor histidine kinase PhoR
MFRRLMASPHAVGVLLVWIPAGAVAIGAASGMADALAVTLAGLGAILATVLLLGYSTRRRIAVTREVRKGLRAAWEALDRKPPGTRATDRAGLPALPGSTDEPEDDDDADADPAITGLRVLPAAIRSAIVARRLEAANLRTVLDAVESAVLCVDARGTVVLCNLAASRFFTGRTRVVGARVEDLFTQAEVLGLHASAVAGRDASAQVRMSRPEGMRICQVMAYRVPWRVPIPTTDTPAPAAAPAPADSPAAAPADSPDAGEREGVVLVIRDVTELAMAVQLKADFVANASHELRTPLSSIRGAVETIRDGAKDEPAMLDRLTQMIAHNVSRLEDLVRDLLDLSRLESPEVPLTSEPVELLAVVEDLREQFAEVCAERRLAIEPSIDDAVAVVLTDAKLLTLILKNLIDNATKFANQNTAIRVVARPTPPRLQGGRPGLRVTVEDRGMGIPIAHQARIFERFYQVDASRAGGAARRGTGLGLAIVKHAVKTLGGTIRVESVWKQGTTMIVELPGVALDPNDSAAHDNDDVPTRPAF